MIIQAWKTAQYHRIKKLPDLKGELLTKTDPKRATRARPWEKQAAAWGDFLSPKKRRRA